MPSTILAAFRPFRQHHPEGPTRFLVAGLLSCTSRHLIPKKENIPRANHSLTRKHEPRNEDGVLPFYPAPSPTSNVPKKKKNPNAIPRHKQKKHSAALTLELGLLNVLLRRRLVLLGEVLGGVLGEPGGELDELLA